MAQYLIVAHQTATSPELLDRASELAGEDPLASFTILVPATPVVHLLTWEEGETNEIASQRAKEARSLFESRGLKVAETKVGDGSLLLAIEDELRAQAGKYEAIVLSTLPPGISRWLRLDVHNQAERKFGRPVMPVVANARIR